MRARRGDSGERPAGRRLRLGFTTGACAAALAAAAWMRLHRPESAPASVPAPIPLLFPDGRERLLPLLAPGEGRMAAIRKDGGDDPDCTHGAILFGGIRGLTEDGIRPEDHVLASGGGRLVVRGVSGVGLCTRDGLACERGRWAVNPGPLRMIRENIRRAGLDSGLWLLELGVERGEELARRTLNPLLGVVGGISLLGSTGLVLPWSHDAYVETIRICMRGLRLSGGRCAVLCTGGTTLEGARRLLPDLPENAFIRIGDHIAEALRAARKNGMRAVAIACMPGKLCKHAAGRENTHARRAGQDLGPLRAAARRLLPKAEDVHAALAGAASVRESLLLLPEAVRMPVLRILADAAADALARRCGGMDMRLALFDADGAFLLDVLRPAPAGAAREPEEPDDGDDAPGEAAGFDAADVGRRYFVDGPDAASPEEEA